MWPPSRFVLAACLLLALNVHQVSAQFQFAAPGDYYAEGSLSDYMYRFRPAVAWRSGIIYVVDEKGPTVQGLRYDLKQKGFMLPIWSSAPMPGAFEAQPVLNVDGVTDNVYFIHPVDGRIYCFDASRTAEYKQCKADYDAYEEAVQSDGIKNAAAMTKAGDPAFVWVSNFVCSPPEVQQQTQQQRQTMTSDGKILLARCNSSVVLMNATTGALIRTYAAKDWVDKADPAARIPVFGGFTRMITWKEPVGGARPALQVWDLDPANAARRRNNASRIPAQLLPLPADTVVAGVNVDGDWGVAAVVDQLVPVVHVIQPFNGKRLLSYDFTSLMNPDGARTNLSVVPTPVLAGGVMYGLLRAMEPSPFPWLSDTYPDKYFWWAFALQYDKKTGTSNMLWITEPQPTPGFIADQAVWVTPDAVFMSDYQQKSIRSFSRTTGQRYYFVPPRPYGTPTSQGTNRMPRGLYRYSLPWTSPDGQYLVIQGDNSERDAAPEDPQSNSMGIIRAVLGQLGVEL